MLDRLSSVPVNAWLALMAAGAVDIAFVLTGPIHDPSAFYGVAAQIVPAFLIALAVERSLLDSLGTKADFARARRDEVADRYELPPLNKGILSTIELALIARLVESPRIFVSSDSLAAARGAGHWEDDAFAWGLFRAMLEADFGIEDEDPDFFDPPTGPWVDPTPGFDALRAALPRPDPGDAIRWLAARAALRDDRDCYPAAEVEPQIVAGELNRMFTAYEKAERELVLRRVALRAHDEYDRQKRRRTLSLRISIVLLTSTELLALAGLVSPGRPYAGLFVLTAALVAASIMNVAGGALADLG